MILVERDVGIDSEDLLLLIPDFKIGCIDLFHEKCNPIPKGWACIPLHWVSVQENIQLYNVMKNYSYTQMIDNKFRASDRLLQEFCAAEKISDELYEPLSENDIDGFIPIIKVSQEREQEKCG